MSRAAVASKGGKPAAIRISLRLNNDIPSDRFVEVAVAAEHAGYEQLWVSHDLLLRSAPVLLAAAGCATTHIRLGAGVLNPYSAHPVEIAMHAVTLHELTGGRALLGIGAGAAGLLGAAGIERPDPLARTRAAIVACRNMLRGARSKESGGTEVCGLPDTSASSLAVAYTTSVPLYVGGMGPRMLALGGALADGVLALLYPPEHYPEARAQVRAGAEHVGRNPDELDVPACIWVSVDDDRVAAERALAMKFAFYGQDLSPYLLDSVGLCPADFAPAAAALAAGDDRTACSLISPAMLHLGIAGTAEDVAQRCAGIVAAGATHLSFGPPLGPDPVRAVGLLAREVFPRVLQLAGIGTPPRTSIPESGTLPEE